ncbi:MAG: inositol monophosphatase family protein [Nanoarchaeota archaeon]
MKQIAIKTAQKAGAYLFENFKKDKILFNERAMSKEIVTKYDKESDRIIINEISKAFPGHNLLTEESGSIDNGSEYTWIVDSLDGTGNFAAGNPFFSVSIALQHKEDIILGVIYAPFLQELYLAETGKGAFLNDKQIRVSEIDEFNKAYIVTCEGGSKTNQRLADIYGVVYPKVKDMRKLGSAAIEGGFVATGRADAYITLDIDPWDVAATVLIAKESGGKATDFKGNPWKPEKTDLLITNKTLHSKLLSMLKSSIK